MATRPEVQIDMQNRSYDNQYDTELLNPYDLEQNIPRDPSIRDWTIPAIFSAFWCCCSVGCCAIYYAIRANYNHDKGFVKTARKHTSTAKVLTLVAIGIGSVVLVACIIAIAVLISRAESAAVHIRSYGYGK